MNKFTKTEDMGSAEGAEGSAERESMSRRSKNFQTIHGSENRSQTSGARSMTRVQEEMSAGGGKLDNPSLMNIPL